MTYWIWENQLGTISLLESCTEEGVIIVDVRDLKDGTGNDIAKLKVKIQLIANLLSIGETVAIRCAAGMSRSNTLACAVMVYMVYKYGEGSWDYHWAKVKKACSRAQENIDFVREVKQALKELGRPI